MNRLKALLLVLAASLSLTACDFSVYEMPLPGGADVGDDPITIQAEFDNVLDLVPQSTVKLADVTVGKVTEVSLDGYTAVVTMQVRRDVELPDDTRADIRQTSLLGEKFVSLSVPPGGGSGRLSDDDVIRETGRSPEVEDVLGAMSLVLNGGGVAQLKTIASELNTALEGREGSARSLIGQFELLMAQVDRNKADIVQAIEALNRLAVSADRQRGTIDEALEELPSALRSIDQQRDDLVKMLGSLDRLSAVGVDVIRTSKGATIDTLQNLTPILSRLSEAGDAFPRAFHVFLTYPFVDDVVGRNPAVARNLHMGDYTNLSIKLDLRLDGGGEGPPDPGEACIPLSEIPDDGPIPPMDQLCQGAVDALEACLADPTVDSCEGLPGAVVDAVCADYPLPGLCPGATETPSGPLPTITLPLPRPGLGDGAAAPAPEIGRRGPTMGDLMTLYDADLVSLMIPGMVTR